MTAVLAGKTALITGGGSGIGEAIARRYAADGARVAVCGRRKSEVGRVARAIGGLALVCDVTDEPDVVAMFAALDSAYGRLDVLVNNAGISGPTAAAEAMDMDVWDQVYAVNVRGLVLCIKHAIPLLKRRGGSIINMASRVGIRPNPLRSAYGSSKFAVRGITECVSQEVGAHGIRVNALCPGAVDTELFRSIARERAAAEGRDVETYIDAAYRRAATLRRLVSLDDVAGTALFLASDASAAITGESIKVDAGRS